MKKAHIPYRPKLVRETRRRFRPDWLIRLHEREMQRVTERPDLEDALCGFLALARHDIRGITANFKTRKGWAL